MVHVYEKHPSKSNKQRSVNDVDKNDREAVMKALRDCVTDYHVDRKFNKLAGIEWIVLCEEITKELNQLYGDLKELST